MLSAQLGSVFLSPPLMQLWDPMWNELSVTKVEGRARNLSLTGHLEIINFALQSLKYLGYQTSTDRFSVFPCIFDIKLYDADVSVI